MVSSSDLSDDIEAEADSTSTTQTSTVQVSSMRKPRKIPRQRQMANELTKKKFRTRTCTFAGAVQTICRKRYCTTLLLRLYSCGTSYRSFAFRSFGFCYIFELNP